MSYKLNLGCGKDIKDRKQGWINIDSRPGEGVDEIMDISKKIDYPDNSVCHIRISHVLEHINNWEDVIYEMHRVLEKNGTLEVRVPYGLDPTAYHVRTFKEWTLDAFLADIDFTNATSLESKRLFKCEMKKINRRLPYHWHIRRYLGLDISPYLPIGIKWEIVWWLRKC